MKVSYNWLKTYINLFLTPEELRDKFNSIGLCVNTLDKLENNIHNVITGQIKSINPHPNADKLTVCELNVGNTKNLKIVCGAKNIKVGDKVAVACDNAILPNDVRIKKTNIRGVLSEGMMCSAKELEISDNSESLLTLSPDTPVGVNIKNYLGLNDYIYDLEVLPNRPDCLGMIGIARALSAVLKKPLNLPKIELDENKTIKIQNYARVLLNDKKLCKRYATRVIFNVKILDSPLWMQIRLKAVGIRPINNIVDITNYVLMETGHPLHAFDYNLLSESTIIVRKARANENLITLDGITRKLDTDMLVIADSKKAIALAGIMGGQETEISSITKNILLESAFFDPVNIRKTSKTLNLSTEASFRFEKGADYEGIIYSLNRTTDLIKKLSGGDVLKGIIDVYPEKIKPVKINVRFQRVNKILGTAIKNKKMIDISKRLGFKLIKETKDTFSLLVPSFRSDICREIDIIEEIAQIYGYHNIKETLPTIRIKSFSDLTENKIEDNIKNTLVSNGLYEVINFSFINKNWFDKIKISNEHLWRRYINILNPLSEEWNILRTSLLPGLLDNVILNAVNRGNKNIKFFEIGSVFILSESSHSEFKSLGIIITGNIHEQSWIQKSENISFYYLKGILKNLFENLNIRTKFVNSSDEIFENYCSCVIEINDRKVGFCGQISSKILDVYDIKNEVYYCEIILPLLSKSVSLNKMYSPINKFPSIKRDISFIINKKIPAEEIISYIDNFQYKLMEKIDVIDFYEGEQIGNGNKSITYSITYRDVDKTLTDKEVDTINNQIINNVIQKFNATIRK